MAKPDSKKGVQQYSDAWSRFEQAIDVVAKSPPQHRLNPASKKRVRGEKTVKTKPGK
jgi:hypothetical protein